MTDRWRIRKGDLVQVIAGKDKGKRGEILKVLRDDRRVVVKGINICVRHRKPTASSPGGESKEEKSIHASNVMLVDSSDDRPTRVGMSIVEGKKVRISKRTSSVVG
ncbi:MAG: 50S ribosomal protein L24 [Holosporaceae bacterium]|jgi:large subunit ribosomal protein L24|nr:50S ribosomal protein L24 [Holosporaceae bacterium]